MRRGGRGLLLLGAATLLVVAACTSFDGDGSEDGGSPDGGVDESSVPEDSGTAPDGGSVACTGASEESDAAPDANCNGTLPVDLLSSPNNCGHCGRVCGADGCTSGFCTLQTFEPQSAVTLTRSATDIVWASEGFAAAVLRKAISGGPTYAMARSSAGNAVMALLVEGPRTYVNTQAELFWVASDATVENAPRTSISANNNTRFGLALDETHLYWGRANVIEAWAKDGASAPADISSSNPDNAYVTGVVADSAALYWTMDGTVVDGGPPNNKLYQRVKGGDVVVRAQQLGLPRAIALDAEHVYWADWDAGTILRARRGDNTAPEIVVRLTDHRYVRSIAVDATHVYWIGKRTAATDYVGQLARAPRCGDGTVEPLALHNAMSDAFVLENEHVYFGALDGVKRVRK